MLVVPVPVRHESGTLSDCKCCSEPNQPESHPTKNGQTQVQIRNETVEHCPSTIYNGCKQSMCARRAWQRCARNGPNPGRRCRTEDRRRTSRSRTGIRPLRRPACGCWRSVCPGRSRAGLQPQFGHNARMPSTNRLRISMDNKETIAHGQCGVG